LICQEQHNPLANVENAKNAVKLAKQASTKLDFHRSQIMADPRYNLPPVMTVRELSAYLRVHPSTIYKLLRKGELPGFRIGTDWRFNAEVIDRWCSERNLRSLDEV
jgi:excisionase family DNA binding protein